MSLAQLGLVRDGWAEDSNISVRLAKAADDTDANKPATLSVQRNDGGETSYVTEGALKGSYDFGKLNEQTASAFASWNHNTLSANPTRTASWGARHLYRLVYSERNDSLRFDSSIGQQRDIIKDSNAIPVTINASWYPHALLEPTKDRPVWATARATVGAFWKDVYHAAASKQTGIEPTGIMSGGLVSLSLSANIYRWSLTGTTQQLDTNRVVAGDETGSHRLSKLELTYTFVDAPQTLSQDSTPGWVPGISLSRQVGDDPLNNVARSGFNLLALTVKY